MPPVNGFKSSNPMQNLINLLTFLFLPECYGVNHHSGPLAGNKSVDSTNIHYFEGCNVVKGSLEFNTLAFGR